MATFEIDSDLEEGEILDSDSCDDNRVCAVRSENTMGDESAKVKTNEIISSDKYKAHTGTKKFNQPETNRQDFSGKPRGKDTFRTKSSAAEIKCSEHAPKRKRTCDSENGLKNSKTDTKGKHEDGNIKKDAFDIVREKAKTCSEESEPPRKISRYEGKCTEKTSNKPSISSRKDQELCSNSSFLSKSGLNSTGSENFSSKKHEADKPSSSKETDMKGPHTNSTSIFKKSDKISAMVIDTSRNEKTVSEMKGSRREKLQDQGETDDLDTEDADASSQTSELDDTLKESDSQKESSVYDFDMKEITESDTATDQQFTENSSPNTHEFEIIDDIGIDDEGGESNLEELSDEDLDDSEIYAWLEEGIDRKALNGDGSNEDGPIEREKVVLKEKGHDPFEVLPEGWVVVTHNSGMPVYLHKQSRVCTLSKPYFLGPGSVRKHDVPVSAVPCLHYSREILKEKEGPLEKESKNETDNIEGNEKSQTEMMNGNMDKECVVTNGDGIRQEINGGSDLETDNKEIKGSGDMIGQSEINDDSLQSNKDKNQSTDKDNAGQSGENVANAPPVKIECAEQRKKENSLDPYEIRKYCERLFQFRTITVKKFKTWKDRRHHLNTQKRRSRPALPSNTKLITCSIPQEKGDDKAKRKEFVLNPTGKSYVCILHEYAQHTLRVQPRYVFRELENAQNPYSATVVINDVEYGTGYASSKKTAKMEAAKATLSILIPAMNQFIDDGKDNAEDYSFFDEIKIEDPRVSDLCNKAGQPSPYQILLECLKRNYGMGDTQCQIDVKTLKHQKSEYSLTVGKHTVTVVCKNKREGKQRAAQAMLQELHPHITGLGSLLRLYGRSSWKCIKEKKKEEHSITELQSQAGSNKPNTAVLDKLKEEMEKIQVQKDAIKSKGKLRVDSSVLPANVKSLDL